MSFDFSRYLDLYFAESQEHLRTLGRSLLELESAQWGEALEQAFRAAHTIKGMAATMGFRAVADLAHALEDRLDALRSEARAPTPGEADALLRAADALGAAVETSADGTGAAPAAEEPAAPAVTDGSVAGAENVAASGADEPTSAGVRIRVTLRADTPLAAARLLLIRRNLEPLAMLLEMEPAEPGPDFDGRVRLVVAPGAEPAALESAIRAAGDVESVRFDAAAMEPPAAAPATERQAGARGPSRQAFVRLEQRRLDDLANGIGELVQLRSRLLVEIGGGHGEIEELLGRLDRLATELQETVLEARMVPVGAVFDRLPRTVRDAARASGREVDLETEGEEIRIDRAILDELSEPLVHLLRNAVDHGIEPPQERKAAGKPPRGRLRVRAERLRSSISIEVEDDGRGVSRERVAARLARSGEAVAPESLDEDALLRVLCGAGFSTAERVTEVSGRGVGLDAVVARVRALGGALRMRTREGAGTTFSLRLPITLALTQALRVRVGGDEYAIPLTHIAEAVELEGLRLPSVRGRPFLELRGEALPLIRLRAALEVEDGGEEAAAVIAEVGARRVALAVDQLIGREQIVIRSFDMPAGLLPYFSGVALLTDGKPALVLDPVSVL